MADRSACRSNGRRPRVLRVYHTLALLLLGCALTLPSAAHAQQRPARIWAGIGLGSTVSPGTNSDAAAVMAQLVYQRAAHHFALRIMGSADLYGNSDALGELGVIYGRVYSGSLGHAMVGTGVSSTTHDRCPNDQETCSSVGLPLVAEVGFSALTIVGIGLQAFANLNTAGSYFGVVAMLQLGWMP